MLMWSQWLITGYQGKRHLTRCVSNKLKVNDLMEEKRIIKRKTKIMKFDKLP